MVQQVAFPTLHTGRKLSLRTLRIKVAPRRPRMARRPHVGARSESDLVHVAPPPRLPGLQRAHDGMRGRKKVRRCVTMPRGIAAADVPAREAETEVHPAC